MGTLAATCAVIVGSGVFAAGAGAQEDPPLVTSTLDYAPAQGGPGTIVSVSGAECFLGLSQTPAEEADISLVTSAEPRQLVDSQSYIVRSDGTWSGEFLIPTTTPPGSYLLLQVCVTDDMIAPFGPPKPFEVLDRAVPTVTPIVESVVAGSSLGVAGANCANANGTLETAIVFMADAGGELVAEGTAAIATDGTFTSAIQVPADVPAGEASVFARCLGSGAWLQTAPVVITVAVPPAQSPASTPAVVATPSFTG